MHLSDVIWNDNDNSKNQINVNENKFENAGITAQSDIKTEISYIMKRIKIILTDNLNIL